MRPASIFVPQDHLVMLRAEILSHNMNDAGNAGSLWKLRPRAEFRVGIGSSSEAPAAEGTWGCCVAGRISIAPEPEFLCCRGNAHQDIKRTWFLPPLCLRTRSIFSNAEIFLKILLSCTTPANLITLCRSTVKLYGYRSCIITTIPSARAGNKRDSRVISWWNYCWQLAMSQLGFRCRGDCWQARHATAFSSFAK